MRCGPSPVTGSRQLGMPSQAKRSFDRNKADIDQLWTIHEDWSEVGTGAGRRPTEVEVLNRAAIVFVAACWEAFVEDLVLEALDHLIAVPPPAWAPPLKAIAQKKLETFHTPKSSQVADLFGSIIGLKGLTGRWKWHNMPKDRAATKLDDFITLRGSVAHRLKLARTVNKSESQAFLNHVDRLANKTDDAVRAHLRGVLGRQPW